MEYRYIARFLRNLIDRETMILELAAKTRQFAKRQRMWLKRDPNIIWFSFPVDTGEVINTVRRFLT